PARGGVQVRGVVRHEAADLLEVGGVDRAVDDRQRVLLPAAVVDDSEGFFGHGRNRSAPPAGVGCEGVVGHGPTVTACGFPALGETRSRGVEWWVANEIRLTFRRLRSRRFPSAEGEL